MLCIKDLLGRKWVVLVVVCYNSYHVLLQNECFVGKHREAEFIIRKSLEDSFELDTVAYNTFIKAMLEAG